MKRTAFQLLVISSVALLLTASQARTRPRYGDTLRADTKTVVMSGDTTPDALVGTVFETLVTVDDSGNLQPGLATNWISTNNGSRWEFTLRSGVNFHDGQPCTPAAIQRAFARLGNIPWHIRATADGLIFESDTPQPNLSALLSLPRYAISATTAEGDTVGTGPFRTDKRTGPIVSLKANDDYWSGRPFVDNLEITTSRTPRDQMTDFTLDRADLIEITPDQWRRAQQDHLRTFASRPAELVAIVVTSSKPELRDTRLRQAISLAIDRAAIHNVIFQRQGEVAASLLPNWLTGYAFLFDINPDVTKARQLRMEVGQVPALAIGYDAANPTERLIAERVALNAHDIGVNMQAVPNTTPGIDLRIRSVALPSLDPATALNGLIDELALMPATSSPTPESLYANERAALQTYSAIPLVFLPRTTALKDRIRNWTASPNGEWHFENVWLVPHSRAEVRP